MFIRMVYLLMGFVTNQRTVEKLVFSSGGSHLGLKVMWNKTPCLVGLQPL